METPSSSSGRLFVGISIPPTPTEVIKAARKRFAPVIDKRVLLKNWHVTFVFIGEVSDVSSVVAAFPKHIPLPFVPIISITHVGQGRTPNSLWAYVQATPAIQELKATLETTIQAANIEYAKEDRDFVPHISLATIQEEADPMAVLDAACPVTFPIREITLYQSVPGEGGVTYTPLASATVKA